MLDWIREKKAENTGIELDDVWELQKKFDEFQTVRKEPPPPDRFLRVIIIYFYPISLPK